jgi:hypothetical protein
MGRMACNNCTWKAANQSKDWRIRRRRIPMVDFAPPPRLLIAKLRLCIELCKNIPVYRPPKYFDLFHCCTQAARSSRCCYGEQASENSCTLAERSAEQSVCTLPDSCICSVWWYSWWLVMSLVISVLCSNFTVNR